MSTMSNIFEHCYLEYLKIVFVRIVLHDLRYFLGQHFPFLGKRHSISSVILSRSTEMRTSVTRTPSSSGTRSKVTFTDTSSALNLLHYTIKPFDDLKLPCHYHLWSPAEYPRSRLGGTEPNILYVPAASILGRAAETSHLLHNHRDTS